MNLSSAALSGCFLFAFVLFLGITQGHGRLMCYQCATSTLAVELRGQCLEGKSELIQCGQNEKYCIMLRYTEEGQGEDKVVLRRGCSPEFVGNFCQYRTLNDGTSSSVCVSSCAEHGCNGLPYGVNMDGHIDYFGKR